MLAYAPTHDLHPASPPIHDPLSGLNANFLVDDEKALEAKYGGGSRRADMKGLLCWGRAAVVRGRLDS